MSWRTPLPIALLLSALVIAACGGGNDQADIDWPASTATGPEVVVPHLAGLDPDLALHKVKKLDLGWHASFPGSQGNPAIESGCSEIYNQAPAAGTRVHAGYQISVTLGVCHRTISRGMRLARLHGTGQSGGRYPAPH